MNPIARALDRLFAWVKWPVAIASVMFLPGLVYALAFVAERFARSPAVLPFAIGAAVYAVAFAGLARRRIGFWTVVEHELTHAIFAWATLHRVVGFAATRSGGHIRYIGRGNWLIAIAPYFFPTFALIAIAVLSWTPPHPAAIGAVILGAAVAHHVLSTWLETHRHQVDLREVGWLWSWMFLPAVNAFVLGLVLAYASGTRSLTAHLSHVRGPTLVLFHWLVGLVHR